MGLWVRKTIKSLSTQKMDARHPFIIEWWDFINSSSLRPATTMRLRRQRPGRSLICKETLLNQWEARLFWFYRQNSSGSAGASFTFLFVIKRESKQLWYLVHNSGLKFVFVSISKKTLRRREWIVKCQLKESVKWSRASPATLSIKRSATTGPF